MARRRKRKAVPSVTIEWNEDVARLFAPVFDDWTPPKTVRAWGDASKSTWVARFITTTGKVNTVRVRLRRGPAGLEVVERSIGTTYKLARAA